MNTLTRDDSRLDVPQLWVHLSTLKQREDKAVRGAGRRPSGSSPH